MISIKIYKKLFAVLALLIFAATGQGQPAAKDSLEYFMVLALKNNPTVLQRFSEYQAALQKVPQVGSLPDPELNLGIFLSPMELVSGRQVADIRLMQMFPWFGTIKSAKDEMSLMAKVKYELFRDSKLQVCYDVQSTWYELYKNARDIRIVEKNIQILKVLERLALVKYKTASVVGGGMSSPSSGTTTMPSSQANLSSSSMGGVMPGGQSVSSSPGLGLSPASGGSGSMGPSSKGSGLADVYRIKIGTGDLENNIALLKNRQSTILARFNSYLNRPPRTMTLIPDTMRADSLDILLTPVTDSMIANNPMLVMLTYEQQSLDARKKMVTRMGLPMVGLGVDYSLIKKNEMSTSSMNGRDMIMPMVTVSLPIYRKKYRSMQTEADLLKKASEQNYTATLNSLQTEYYQAVQLYQDAGRRMKLYSDQYLLASKTLDIMLKSYSVSASELTDVLRVQQQTYDYEQKEVEALTDYNTGIAWLKKLMSSSRVQ